MRPEEARSARLFVAVPLPQELYFLAVMAQEALCREDGIRVVDGSRLHCTLVFIGEVQQCEIPAAARAVAGIPVGLGGDVYVGRFMFLPSERRARVLVLGLDDRHGVLSGLRAAVSGRLEEMGVGRRDERPFRAHATVARIKKPRSMQPMADCEPFLFGVESVCLYQSELRREGPVYSVLERVDLQRAYGQ